MTPTPTLADGGPRRSHDLPADPRPGRQTRPSGPVVALALIAALLTGCAEEAGLSVGNVSFARTDLLGLSNSQTELLAMITAIGLATADGEAARLGGTVLERRRDLLLIERLRQEDALERAGVTDTALEARYAEDPEFELTVRHLVILSERWRSPEERARARERAQSAQDRARQGESFPELAGEVSEEPGADARGGLLEPGRKGSWVDEFWEAASSLAVGEISDVVESEYGFHVLRLDGREPVSFAEARPQVAAAVAAELDDPEAWRRRVSEWTGGASIESSDGLPSDDPSLMGPLLAEAQRLGLSVSSADEARLDREWELEVAGWASAFGFEPGMSVQEIQERALAALGSTEQNARIVRDVILGVREALLAAYQITVSEA